jgi:hypothetical protein
MVSEPLVKVLCLVDGNKPAMGYMYEVKQMFVSNEWHDFAFSTRQDGRAITKLVYIASFREGVEEVCTVSKPLVKVIHLVDGDKPITGYSYEAMARAKKAMRSYYGGKGTLRQKIYEDLGFD